jgi:copper homeostasis protein (lipoprotein)
VTRWITAILLLILTAAAAPAAGGTLGHVTGTASYRERIELPPGAMFEAILEDVSVVDAPARELGRATMADPGNPPFVFDISYDHADIRPERKYSVRTQVSVGRRLIFVSDTVAPVLTHGAPSEVEIWMIKVGDTEAEAREAPTAIGAHGLRLPASFQGELPCPDCEGLRYRLNLWPDQVFHLRRNWRGKEVIRDAIGRWSADPVRRTMTLRGAEDPIELRIIGADKLGLTGEDGKEHVLKAADEFHPFDPHLPLRGMLNYVGDEARFTECLTGRDYPLVRGEGDYEALAHAYLAAGAEAGGAIMASFDGGIVRTPDANGENVAPQVLVERFVGIWPGETCERPMGEASLTNTYWKILKLGHTALSAGEGQREPNLILREDDPHFTATVGCNQILGGYTLEADRLAFQPGPQTAMACPEPLEAWERQLVEVLAGSVAWRIDGQTLELLDAAGNPLALLQAVYLY